jgi:two-component system, OmpR family, sensor histidine kinase CpxA
MTLRFPLYAKILLWFFLNLLLLGAAFLLLVRAQFHYGLDWLLAAGAGERIQAITDVIVGELGEKPRSDWDTVLKRFDDAYRIHFLIYHADGNQLAGTPYPLPPEIRMRLGEGRLPPGFRPPVDNQPLQEQPPEGSGREGGPPDRLGLGPPPWSGGARPGPEQFAPRGPHPKFIVRTTDPTRYWLVVRIPNKEPEHPRSGPLLLVAMSPTMSAGGLFFDFRPWLAVALGAVAFSALLWAPLVRSITHSIAQMTQTTQQIAEGRFEARAREGRRDELGLLGQSINRMAARLAGFVSGQKRFLGDVAHELCSPLARIQVALGILEQRADEKNQGYVDDLREEVQHMSSLVNELLSFSKASLGASTIKLQPVRLREIADKAVNRETAEGVKVEVQVADDLRALAEPDLLLRSLSNLLRNAVRYAGHAGPITVSAHSESDRVVITVADCGPGVPEAELSQIFDPFYRVDSSRDANTGGVGLGLAIVKTCIESCGGAVSCSNRQPSGLEVELKLRAAPKEPTPGASAVQNG